MHDKHIYGIKWMKLFTREAAVITIQCVMVFMRVVFGLCVNRAGVSIQIHCLAKKTLFLFHYSITEPEVFIVENLI